jgi:hypothetical protein
MKFFKHLTVQTHNQVGAQTGSSESLQMFNTESLTNLPESANIDSRMESDYVPYHYHVGAKSDGLPNILDAEVQTKSLWKLFKKGLKKFFCNEPSQDNAFSNQIAESNVQDNAFSNQIAESNVQDNASSIYESAESCVQDNASSIYESAESCVQDNASSIYESAESLLQIAQNYDIMDSLSYAEAVNQASSTYIFDYMTLNGIDTYVLIINNFIYSVNPDLITPFL